MFPARAKFGRAEVKVGEGTEATFIQPAGYRFSRRLAGGDPEGRKQFATRAELRTSAEATRV